MLQNHVSLRTVINVDNPNPVIVLEGSRTISTNTGEILQRMGQHLLELFPNAKFRSGNADGADDWFVRGAQNPANNGANIELMLPYAGHKKTKIPPNSNVLPLEQLSDSELDDLKHLVVQASPKYKALMNYFDPNAKGRRIENAKYILRDALKICGNTTHGFLPASFALFYLNPYATKPGGTEHTMRVANYCKVPYQTQQGWAFSVPTDIYTPQEIALMAELKEAMKLIMENIPGDMDMSEFLQTSEEYATASQYLLAILMRYGQ
jgi:hypothetical protein